ncbi:flagellar hook-basal body complex protein FliE [Qipengyuania sp. YIM B01966]|uniref:flagellar hook-basal body complex protein FliE n=1 Tax=Qipengyuania sp. YIM B01966 TaxID=2778646 RepID=UPI0018F36260|nr:flagellar hook-basal body complex protein FliE [Qipengyuania sp. YIM B01966]
MSIGALDAATAYARLRPDPVGEGLPATSPSSAPEAPGFGQMVSELVGSTTSALRQAEAAGINQLAGKGDLIDVVTAINAAEQALDTVVAVRDRVVGAYGEIMRMQI